MTTIVNNFSYRGENYTIVNDGKYYMTVNHKFVDANGTITKELHFNDGLHTNETLEGCIEDTKYGSMLNPPIKEVQRSLMKQIQKVSKKLVRCT